MNLFWVLILFTTVNVCTPIVHLDNSNLAFEPGNPSVLRLCSTILSTLPEIYLLRIPDVYNESIMAPSWIKSLPSSENASCFEIPWKIEPWPMDADLIEEGYNLVEYWNTKKEEKMSFWLYHDHLEFPHQYTLQLPFSIAFQKVDFELQDDKIQEDDSGFGWFSKRHDNDNDGTISKRAFAGAISRLSYDFGTDNITFITTSSISWFERLGVIRDFSLKRPTGAPTVSFIQDISCPTSTGSECVQRTFISFLNYRTTFGCTYNPTSTRVRYYLRCNAGYTTCPSSYGSNGQSLTLSFKIQSRPICPEISLQNTITLYGHHSPTPTVGLFDNFGVGGSYLTDSLLYISIGCAPNPSICLNIVRLRLTELTIQLTNPLSRIVVWRNSTLASGFHPNTLTLLNEPLWNQSILLFVITLNSTTIFNRTQNLQEPLTLELVLALEWITTPISKKRRKRYLPQKDFFLSKTLTLFLSPRSPNQATDTLKLSKGEKGYMALHIALFSFFILLAFWHMESWCR